MKKSVILVLFVCGMGQVTHLVLEQFLRTPQGCIILLEWEYGEDVVKAKRGTLC